MKKLLISTFTAMTLTMFTSASSAEAANPLADTSGVPFGAVPFNLLTPTEYENAIMLGIDQQNKEIKTISSNPEAPTFENTIVALDRSGDLLTRATLALSNVEHAVGDTVLMNIMAKVTPLLTEHSADIMLNEPLWKRVKSVYDSRGSRADLTPEQQRLLSETYFNFIESGASLEGKARERFKALQKELSDLTLRYGQNITNGMKQPDRVMWLTADQLGGLPESIKTAARATASELLEVQGKKDDPTLYAFTVFAPSYSPFMKYSTDRSLREKLYRLYNSRNIGGEFDNTQVLKDIANIRLELARMLGYDNFAQYNLKRTMAATPEAVMEFLGKLNAAYTPAMKAEVKEIEDFARKSEGTDFVLMPWDYSFWADKLKNDQYAFNDEDMKPYFELNHTIKGVFGLAEKLYGYRFKENKNIPVYHPDVKAYEVYDDGKNLIGILYADFYYRPGKAPGAWMTEFRPESRDDQGNKTLPLISIVCNFSKPVGNEAVLLTPSEVETFLHEFGHALHGLSANTTYASLSGTNVYHDFVELFSQFNENYLTEKKFLDGFARHYKTGKPMPQELIDRFVKASRFGAAYSCMRQLGFGYLDMAYYTLTEPMRASADVEEFEKNAQNPVRVFDAVEGCMTSPSFGHIFSGGYAAGYYGYKWAEALDADAFAAFKEKGIFDKTTARKFRKMLQSGGTVDPMELYIEFRGHKPGIEALLERDGINTDK